MKHLMKRPLFFLLSLMMLGSVLTGCIIIEEMDYGDHGRDGKAYFGIDYDTFEPYSYWDNNPSLPYSPWYGEMYRSNPGTYNFEYFINQDEYWYGTYTLRINHGQPGQANNIPGLDGTDTYLLLICNRNGFYFEDWENCACTRTSTEDSQTIEMDHGDYKFSIEMKKTTVRERTPLGNNKLQ